ncbi:hypothetical protein [Natrinema salaciae]|uniref:Uncharacterized protein n=1 Tax=Natrinema salaciae TaxID=1186196 RepID=A0A1H9G130_9EURY|nr:hypothetical protein [Natrinema salaciae]SEQ43633.1 hypothetical protein SAMN04489841_1735 [Natrinema salaciae]
MGRSVVRSVWSELVDDGPVLVFSAGLVLLSAVLEIGWPSIATVGGTMIAVRTLEALRSAAGIPPFGSGLVIGAGVTGYSASLLRTEVSWVAVSFLLVGAWFVLDACYEWRRGITPPDGSAEELIATTLHESSMALPPDRIADRTGLTLEVVERTLAERADDGVIERVGNRYTIRERTAAPVDRLWNALPHHLRLFSGRSWRE